MKIELEREELIELMLMSFFVQMVIFDDNPEYRKKYKEEWQWAKKYGKLFAEEFKKAADKS